MTRQPLTIFALACILASYPAAAQQPDDACIGVIEFDDDAFGDPLPAGTVVDSLYGPLGVIEISTDVTTDDGMDHPAMIFDSFAPTAGEEDLGTPNSTFGGAGIGAGGAMGMVPGENGDDQLNVLIMSENGTSLPPTARGDGRDSSSRGCLLRALSSFSTCRRPICSK